MHYDLRAPCHNCPFRTDVPPYIHPARVRDIEAGLDRGTFTCHKTVERADDEAQTIINEDNQHHCAGALILLEKMERPSQMMRICERIGMYDRTKLNMEAPVYDTFDEMFEAHKDAENKLQRRIRKKK